MKVSLHRNGKAAVLTVHRVGELADESVFIGLLVTRRPESARRLVAASPVKPVETGANDHTHVFDEQLKFKSEFGAGW